MICIKNTDIISLDLIPDSSFDDFRRLIVSETRLESRLSGLFIYKDRLLAILARDHFGDIAILSTRLSQGATSYPSLTPECPSAHWFERLIHEKNGIEPKGHPWLKPVRFSDANATIGETDFFQVQGEEIHEVGVGPVHAGIIEPGHFRFQCHGEEVLHLEISLGYQHRGIERALIDPRAPSPNSRTLPYMETLAGDTTVAHALAYSHLIETHLNRPTSREAQILRGIALELERLANHTGDIGALAGDVGFLPTSAYCGRIRGEFLNMTALLCGNRMGRSFIQPGGIGHAISIERLQRLDKALREAYRDVKNAVGLLWQTPSVITRFEGTGIVSPEMAKEIGLVGPAARASGQRTDIRIHHPFGAYRGMHMTPHDLSSGDVWARARIRWEEIITSVKLIQAWIEALSTQKTTSQPVQQTEIPSTPITGQSALRPNHLGVSLTEGWRGEVAHIAITNQAGHFDAYHIFDPSFHNWFGLAMALRKQGISDFPLCNKSFNLSYAGHDL